MYKENLYSNELVAHDLALEYLRTSGITSKDELLATYQETYKYFLEELNNSISEKDNKSDHWFY